MKGVKEMFVSEKLAEHANSQPNKVITSYQGREMTYAEIFQQAKNTAGYFQAKGYEKGDIIALFLPNSDNFVICYYACRSGGFSLMPVNTKLTASEVEYIFSHSGAKAIIYDERYHDVLNQAGLERFNDCLIVGEKMFAEILSD